jgi:hypothetical protein
MHHESNKIGFAFLCFFCDFLRNLQESGELQILLKFHFCAEAHEKNRPFAMWPLGGRPAVVRPNSSQPPAGAGRARAVDAREGGEMLGSVHSRPGLELAAAASNGAGGGLTVARPG